MNTRTFHHGDLNSPRIAKLLAFLKERGKQGATSIEISDVCCTPRSASDVSELRANGIGVTCRHESTSEAGRRIYRYTLDEFLAKQQETPTDPQPPFPVTTQPAFAFA